mmetsp:Transcript_57387/g.134771  ORF Transcript_57387/g.134771 Transcript_57387/m.134771 type:complete len:211 (+) Transcript_57387:362-994(+)
MPQYLLHVASQCAYVVPPLRAPVANSSTMHADRQHWKHVVLSSEFRVRLSQPKYPGTPSYVIASALVCLDCLPALLTTTCRVTVLASRFRSICLVSASGGILHKSSRLLTCTTSRHLAAMLRPRSSIIDLASFPTHVSAGPKSDPRTVTVAMPVNGMRIGEIDETDGFLGWNQWLSRVWMPCQKMFKSESDSSVSGSRQRIDGFDSTGQS